MIVHVEVPDQFAEEHHLGEPLGSRALLEAYVLQHHAAGELSAGQVRQALGLSFQATEEFLHDHSAPGLGQEEHLLGLANLQRLGRE